MQKQLKHVIFLIIMSLFLMIGGSAFADDGLFQSMAEQSIYQEINDGHYIKSRQKVEEMLKASPDSLSGNYMMGLIFWNGEGNLHRALQYMKKTIKLFEEKYCSPETGVPKDGSMMAWHQRFYKELADVYAELDMRELEYATHVKLADLYHAKLGEDAVWSMIKLDKFDEAREISLNSINGHDTFWADTAYNNLVALEDARHAHWASYEMSLKSVEFHADKSCVVLMNHARALSTLLMMDESIQYFLKAATLAKTDCLTHPLMGLSSVYLSDGAWQKAISSMMRVRQRKLDKREAVQAEMNERMYMSVILYEMGFSERALDLMTTVIKAPSRLGYDSLQKEQQDMANQLVYYAVLRDALTRTEEALEAYTSTEPFWIFNGELRTRVRELQSQRMDISRLIWSSNQKLFKYALNAKNLKSFLVPYYVLPIPSFLPVVVDALGRRTGEIMLDSQRKMLDEKSLNAMESVFFYMEAYIAWRDESYEAFTNAVERYRGKHVKRQKLMDVEIELMEADFLDKQLKHDEANAKYSRVYNEYPSLFRSREVKLPVSIDPSMQQSEKLSEMADALKHSRRFIERNNAPFIISGSADGDIPVLCISSTLGQRFACSSKELKDYSNLIDGKPHIAEVIDNFYHAAFSPRVDMTQSDIHSLDGSTRVITADEALENLLKAAPEIKDAKKADVSDLLDE